MKNIYFAFAFGFSLFQIQAQNVAIADADFKNLLVASSPSTFTVFDNLGNAVAADANADGQIQVSEALAVYKIEFSDVYYIEDMTGIQAFANLRELKCVWSGIQNLPLAGLSHLERLDCQYNSLQNLDVSGLTSLTQLICNNNQITAFSVAGLSALTYLDMNSNWLTSLDLSGAVALQTVRSEWTQLTTLDTSDQMNLQELYLQSNPLHSLFIKNGSIESTLDIYSPDLEYICADESQVPALMQSYSFPVNSYCSFTPGGQYFEISGIVKFDLQNDGCTASDINYPNMKFNLSNGSQSAVMFGNQDGSYALHVTPGTHTITPILENPGYFNITPSSSVIAFPVQASPHIQNYCVTANGVHNDVAVSLFPQDRARPGFDANYILAYRNKGNTAQSGTITVSFDDAVVDFVSSDQPAIVGAGTLTFSFGNLLPFEGRQIELKLNLNSPTENPPLNSGNVLSFNANINAGPDDTPLDNTFTLSQAVVNSFDPNDKSCLEGANVGVAKVGDYVHYLIRFENTGTFPAENIVVKDMIDTSKFNVNTLVPLTASHPFATRITDTNKLEFIFENINLPFDDANNDGYVAFKIKTKPTLVVGDSFSNNASIYFDYNFPIVTNTATTAIQMLGNPDFEFSDNFVLYPNPVKNVLNIESKNGVEVNSVSIYNTLGQLLQVATGSAAIDVSRLQGGTYIVKVNSNRGMTATRFVKQ